MERFTKLCCKERYWEGELGRLQKHLVRTDEFGHVVLDKPHVLEHVPLLLEEKMSRRGAAVSHALLIRDRFVEILVDIEELAGFGK
jgi:hypothetical protein